MLYDMKWYMIWCDVIYDVMWCDVMIWLGDNGRDCDERVLFVQHPREQGEWCSQTLACEGFDVIIRPAPVGCWTVQSGNSPPLYLNYCTRTNCTKWGTYTDLLDLMHVPPTIQSIFWLVFDPKWSVVNDYNSAWSSTSLCCTPTLATRSCDDVILF